jgi:antirestriction protein ArdC
LPDEIATKVPPPPPGLIEPTVEALKATGITFHIGGERAFYAPAEDYVQVPPPQAYFEPINWHRTALHELGHYADLRIMPRRCSFPRAGVQIRRDLSA